jgi:hypothetical protein
MIGIATTKSAGSTTNNAWGRPILMNVATNGTTYGMTHWIGSWVNGGGGSQLWTYGTTNWSGPASLSAYAIVATNQSTISYSVSKTSLGVTTGDTLYFDAYSSGGGGGDSAVDALANPSTSITSWGQTYTSSTTNNTIRAYTLSYNVSDSDGDGLPDAWETEKFGNLSESGTGDTDSDGSTNAQEFAIGTNPANDDSDGDTLKDGVETGTGIFVSSSNTGTNPLDTDSDNDGALDGAEVTAGTNPNKYNYSQITAVGSFQGWSPAPASDGSNVLSPVAGDEFGWQLNYRMSTAATYVGKFTTGSWSQNWGTSSIPGLAQSGGLGNDIPFNVTATGVWRFYFNTDTLAYSFARAAAPATYADWAAQYGLAADSGSEDTDSDTLTNTQEFAANTDPSNTDTDGDGISDSDETSGAYANLKLGSPLLTNPLTGDTDADGLPDKWELDNYLDPTDNGIGLAYTNYIPSAYGLTVTSNPNGAGSNPDGDALTNLQEFSGGKNPLVAEGDVASTYAKVVVAGSFVQTKPDGSWDEVGNALNTMQLVSNFTWKLIAYVPSPLPSFAQFKFTTGSWSPNFGDNVPAGGSADGVGDLNGSNINALPVFTTAGYYTITFNDFSKAYTITPLAVADVDSDGLPDEWEAFYGGYLNPKITDLTPETAYVSGSATTAAQAFAAGTNPVVDTVAPSVALAVGTDRLVWLALNSGSGQYTGTAADVVATDNIGTPSVAVLHRLISGSNPGVFDAVDTSTAGLWHLEYTATDGSGNATSLTRVVVVGDQPPTYYSLHYPAAGTITTVGTFGVYAQVYINHATPGAGQAPNIQCWIGVNNADTDPSTWSNSAWTPATNNAGQTGNNDEYSATLSGATLGAGTYYYAARWQIGSGAYFYGGIDSGGNGNAWNATTHPSGVLTVNAAVTREVTFAVDMGVQIFKGTFNPATNGVEVRATFNNFAGGVSPLSREGTTTVYSGTFAVEGAESSTNNYKFFSTGTSAVGYEGGSDRQAVLTANAVPLNTGTNFFSGVSESRKLTLRVDMTTQIAKGNFNPASNSVSVIGSFNSFNTTANVMVPAPGAGANVYAATVFLDGPQTGNIEYKFFNNAVGAPNGGYEIARENANRTFAASGLGENLTETTVTAIPLFSNDDWVGPTLSLNGSATVNLNVGDSFTDDGATATDLQDGTCTVNTAGSVNTAAAGTYTLTYTSSDVAGNASVPASVTRTVVVAAASGSTFTGWAGAATLDATNVGKYAIGGASSPTATDGVKPTSTVSGGNLVLTAIVRVDDPKLSVFGEVVTSLANYGTPAATTMIDGADAADQTGVPAGHKRQTFTVPQGADSRKFLRLKATLTP